MAKARRTVKTRVVTEETPIVQLELSIEEAEALTLLLSRVVFGHGETSRQRHTQAIQDALRETGIRSWWAQEQEYERVHGENAQEPRGSISWRG